MNAPVRKLRSVWQPAHSATEFTRHSPRSTIGATGGRSSAPLLSREFGLMTSVGTTLRRRLISWLGHRVHNRRVRVQK